MSWDSLETPSKTPRAKQKHGARGSLISSFPVLRGFETCPYLKDKKQKTKLHLCRVVPLSPSSLHLS